MTDLEKLEILSRILHDMLVAGPLLIIFFGYMWSRITKKLTAIVLEVSPNGGKSLKDQITRSDARLEKLEKSQAIQTKSLKKIMKRFEIEDAEDDEGGTPT